MRTPHQILTALALALVFLPTEAISAPGNGKGKGKAKGKGKGKAKVAPAFPGKGKEKARGKSKPLPPGQAKKLAREHQKRILSAAEITRLRFHDRDHERYRTHFHQYREQPHGLPPGLAKNLRRGKPLPPGWEKKLKHGWAIDDDHWSHFHPVPVTSLPAGLHHPEDTELYLIGNRLVRVYKPRREIVDIIQIASILLRR